jgi:hypothetical protein
LLGVAANDEVYAVGWVTPGERLVLRALAVATFEEPSLDPDQQLSFAAYYLLPEETWSDVERWPDELIERTVGIPLDVIQRRRSLPPLGVKLAAYEMEAVCA